MDGIYYSSIADFLFHFAGIFVSNQDIYARKNLYRADIVSRFY